jgi:predicted O-methyltransferase YrrM
MTPERWSYIGDYATDVFGQYDEHLAGLMARAAEAGLPKISVSADVGRLLKILVSMTEAELAVELGTLAGYSGIWILRLATVEVDHRRDNHSNASPRPSSRPPVSMIASRC